MGTAKPMISLTGDPVVMSFVIFSTPFKQNRKRLYARFPLFVNPEIAQSEYPHHRFF